MVDISITIVFYILWSFFNIYFLSFLFSINIGQLIQNMKAYCMKWWEKKHCIIGFDIKNHRPQLSASDGDISCAFFYHQHERSRRIVNTRNYHLSHSKRKLQITLLISQRIIVKPSKPSHKKGKKEQYI